MYNLLNYTLYLGHSTIPWVIFNEILNNNKKIFKKYLSVVRTAIFRHDITKVHIVNNFAIYKLNIKFKRKLINFIYITFFLSLVEA